MADSGDYRALLEHVFERVLPGPREADMDGMLHRATPDCCDDECRECRGRAHLQGVYHGMAYLCERCPVDALQWRIAGTYSREPDDIFADEVLW